MKARVLLYNLPPSGGDLFPISLGYIAASLKKNKIQTVLAEIQHLNSRTGQEVTNFVLEFKPTIVGFSVYQANIKLALNLAKLVKLIDPNICVVIGGPQVTFMPVAALEPMECVDVLIQGEGEVVMLDLVKCIESQGDISKVCGIVYMCDNKIYQTKPKPLVKNLDQFASPYKSSVFNLKMHSVATMLTSRGCSFNCSFCYTPLAFERKIRAHSSQRILSDIQLCVNAKISKFFFADPSFTFNKNRVKEIMQGIISKKWKIEIWCETRTDLIDESLLQIMAKAGVKRIAYGLESADDKVNTAINKKLSLQQFEKIVKITQRLGIEVEVFTLYGLPKQDYQSCLKTLELLKKLGIKLTGNSGGQKLNLFFGTDITDNPLKFGIKVKKKKKPSYISVGEDFETEYISPKQLKQVRRLYDQEANKVSKKEKGSCISLI